MAKILKIGKGLILIILFVLISVSNSAAQLNTGDTAPDFEFLNQKGEVVKLSDFKDKKYVYLDFFATWCGTCMYEMKYMDKIYDEAKDSHVEFISISLDRDEERFKNFVKKKAKKYTWPMLYAGDKNKIQDDYNIKVFPTFYLIAPDGKFMELKHQFPDQGMKDVFYDLRDRPF